MHWECVPGSRRSKRESTRTYRLGFRPGDWQRSFEFHRWSQMSVDCGRRAEIGQVVGSKSVQASVYKSTQFEPDAIWHLEPVQLSSHNFGNRRTMWELQNKSGGSTERTNFSSRYFDRRPGIHYSSRLGCGSESEPASVQHLSSGTVITSIADRNRCQSRCWRDSKVSCWCRSGHRDLKPNWQVGHQHHRQSCWIRRSAAVGDSCLAISTRLYGLSQSQSELIGTMLCHLGYNFGIPGSALLWLHSYLEGRTQHISVRSGTALEWFHFTWLGGVGWCLFMM